MVPPPLPPPPRFKLHPAAWICWGVACLVVLGVTMRQSATLTPYELVHRFGLAIFVGLIPAVVSWLSWRISRRSQIAATVTFFVVFGLLLIGQLGVLVGKGVVMAATVGETETKYLAQVKAAEHQYELATAKADTDHILNFAWLSDRDKLAPRRADLIAAKAANTNLRRLLAEGESTFRQALEQAGVPASLTEPAVTGFHKAQVAKLPLILNIRDLDDKMFTALLMQLDLLEEQWGHWSLTQGKLVFDNDAALARYRDALAVVQAAGKEQASSQQQLGLIKP